MFFITLIPLIGYKPSFGLTRTYWYLKHPQFWHKKNEPCLSWLFFHSMNPIYWTVHCINELFVLLISFIIYNELPFALTICSKLYYADYQYFNEFEWLQRKMSCNIYIHFHTCSNFINITLTTFPKMYKIRNRFANIL